MNVQTTAPLRILLLGAGLSTSNMGVGALTGGLARCIRANYPDAHITLLDYSSSETRVVCRTGKETLQLDTIAVRFSWKLHLPGSILRLVMLALFARLLPGSIRERMLGRIDICARIRQFPVCGAISGGDSFSDLYGLRQFLYVALPMILVVLLGRRLVLLPQTYGPYRSPLVRALSRFILKSACVVCARDFHGKGVVASVVGKDPIDVRFCHDAAFVLEPDDTKPLPPVLTDSASTTKVGLNVSGLLYMGGYNRKNMFALRVDYRKLMVRMVTRFLGDPSVRLVLVPHVFGADPESESDSSAIMSLEKILPRQFANQLTVVDEQGHDHCSIKALIGKFDFFVGSRMHACIAAISQHVPAASLAYSQKFAGVMETVGLPELTVDVRCLGEDDILERVFGLFENRNRVRRQLQGSVPKIKEWILGFFHEVFGCDSVQK